MSALRRDTRHRRLDEVHRGVQRQQRVLRQDPAACWHGASTIDPDILAPTFWLAGRLIGLGWVQKLPLDQIPNAANLRDDLQNPAGIPTGEYTLPWQTGMTGIAYNLERDRPGARQRSTTCSTPSSRARSACSPRCATPIGLMLLGAGHRPVDVSTFKEAAPAFEKLEQAKSDGQIRAFTGNDYLDDLSTGNFAGVRRLVGRRPAAVEGQPGRPLRHPRGGGMRWADTMVC